MTLTLETASIFAMWLVVVLRLPQVIRNLKQRPLWTAVVLMAVVTTLYLDVAQQALADHIGAYAAYLGTHLATVVSAAAILYFIMAANGYRRYAPWLYAATGVTIAVLLWVYIAEHPRNPRPGHAPELPLGYFILVSGFSVVALVVCALVCGYGARRADNWTMRWALFALTIGWAANALPWLLNIVWLVTRDLGWIAWFSQIDGISALGLSIGAALPLVPAIQQSFHNSNAYRRLGPLWQSLTDAFPDVRLTQPAISQALYPVRLRLYRRVVEIRDAMIVLRSYVSADDMQAAHEQVERHKVPDAVVDASVTACWLVAALHYRQQGRTPVTQTDNIAGVGGDNFEQEIEFLLQVADAYSSGLASTHVITGGVS